MNTSNIVLQHEISKYENFRVWKNEHGIAKRDKAVLNFIVANSDFESLTINSQACIRQTLKNICSQLRRRWMKCHRNEKYFLKYCKASLDIKITFSVLASQLVIAPGRPIKAFEACSESSKRRKVRHLIQEASSEELNFATRMSLRSSGRRDAADLVKKITCYSPERATKIKKNLIKPYPTKMTKVEALALYVDTKMTKKQYCVIRENAKDHGANNYPPYEQLLSAKKDCYPPDLIITEISAEAPLQSLLDHTIKRFIQVQDEVLARLKCTEMKMLFKWGCDGAAGQSRYKQCFTDDNADDSFLFSISLVPLKLVTNKNNEEIVIWHNPATSSTKYCRPIKIIFQKETQEFVKSEIEKVKTQISKLVPYSAELNANIITCNFELYLTTVDGKICSWMADMAGQCCHICGAKPKEMNNISRVSQRPVNKESLALGISSLHAWIKVLECILHIAYRLDVKKWQIRQSDKERVGEKKKEIQDKFRREMGLLIDVPKSGFGTSNDGNTARRVLGNAVLSSQITGVDENLISRLNIILIAMASGYEINSNLFESYCMLTAKLYVEKYNWYYMPQSLHKILVHGGLLINKAILPIGQMSEEDPRGA